MLFFHAFTGCDVISFFFGRGKKSAWHMWEVLPEPTDIFLELASSPVTVSEDIMLLIETFVVLWYDRTISRFRTVDEARQHLFCRRSRTLENIPPTSAALYSILYVLCIRLDMCGGKPFKMTRLYLALLTGVGRRVALTGSQYGAPFSKLKKHVMRSYTVSCRGLCEWLQ